MKPQLFLFHYAGGNCYSYQFLYSFLSVFEIHALELPGRGKRMTEALPENFSDAAADLFLQIKERLNGEQFFIYGHSMGAELGFVITYMLEAIGNPPAALFVTGNPGPGIRKNKNRHKMEHDAFVKELRELGGISEEFFENQELMEFFEPIIRADFRIIETKDDISGIRLKTRITAVMGDSEEDHDHISNWQKFTRGVFRSELLKGDHFFIFEQKQRMAEIIAKNIQLLKK
jgi:surfactin synthase thioesterase subunit